MLNIKYRVVDWTEFTIVCRADKLLDCDKAANQFFIDTDGDASMTIEKLDKTSGKYVYYREPKITRKSERTVYGE